MTLPPPSAITPSSAVSRDWHEDASHENGNYDNRCVECGETFTGHKRRVICRACALAVVDGADASASAIEAREGEDPEGLRA